MLYKKQRAALPVWLLTGVAILALLLGFVAGRLSAPQPNLASVLAPSREHLRRAAGALEIVNLEYARAQAGNSQSAAASLSAARQARTELAAAGELRELAPRAVSGAEAQLRQLEHAVQGSEPLSEIRQQLDRLRQTFATLPGAGLPR